MPLQQVVDRGLVLLGCGKMGSAMLDGWLARGVPPASVWVVDPHPSNRLRELASQGLHLNTGFPDGPAVCIIAVKPQVVADALPQVLPMTDGRTLFVSIAAGTPIAAFESMLGQAAPIVRAMPNTPAAIGQGITALIGNDLAGPAELDLAGALLKAVGQVVHLSAEAQMDAVTALSGSGPAYVFHLIEAMAAAGVGLGLPPDLALHLARATVAGAGALAQAGDTPPEQLRRNVTSPGGTTEAALRELMDDGHGLVPLMQSAMQAAARRSRELAG